MNIKKFTLTAQLFVYSFLNIVYATELTEYETCVLKKTLNASSNTLATKIAKQCESLINTENYQSTLSDQNSIIETRLMIDQSNQFKPFTLMAFKPNYIIPAAYNFKDHEAYIYQQLPGEQDFFLDDLEAQFQISIKTPLAVNLFNKGISLYTGYTNRSFWQVYNSEISRPFRETNHEPELWLQTTRSTNILGFDNRINMLGVSHHSNGQSGILSRSWNIVYANFSFEKESFVFSIKLWSRFSENPVTDDNPDITEFMGHGEFRLIYKKEGHTFNLMSRNNIESGFDKGATEFSWSFPIGDRKDLRWYIRGFSGYAESLIDYNKSVHRIGFGISLSDWL